MSVSRHVAPFTVTPTAGGGALQPKPIYRYFSLFYRRSWLTTKPSRGDEKKKAHEWSPSNPLRRLFNYLTVARCRHVRERDVSLKKNKKKRGLL